jgi:predicted phage-related endonuclease
MKIGHAKILSKHMDHTDAWHAMRRGGIGGSEAATVLGLEPYGNTRLDLWNQKTGRVEKTFAGNLATQYGTQIESYIRDRLTLDHGYRAFATMTNSRIQIMTGCVAIWMA